MERSVIRVQTIITGRPAPDYAALHPGYQRANRETSTIIREDTMPNHVGCIAVTARVALLGVSFAALIASAQAAEYKMTVNRDRLINSANEPQNWLMMNGDYGSTRYSKLAQINRDNVKNLRMVWAMALRGMQDIGQNGPEN